ncbi:MAG: hypothetical protein EOO48_08505 [Flavobacterium sp.]|nr:MAG: hypothetical protein EOO48_08505 [Flavobacterium sp.]
MKKLAFAILFLFSVTSYGKGIPTPFWYSISEKILNGAHQLISDDVPLPAKPKIKTQKLKGECTPLKCIPKKEKSILPTPFFTIKADGMWLEAQ